MLNNVSLIVGLLVVAVTAGAGLVSLGIRIGSYVKKEDCISAMDKINETREECKKVHDHALKNANVSIQGIPTAYISKTEMAKHEQENKESFSKIEKHLEEISQKIDNFFLKISVDVELLKSKVVK